MAVLQLSAKQNKEIPPAGTNDRFMQLAHFLAVLYLVL